MSEPSNIKIQKTGAGEIGNAQALCPLLILALDRIALGWDIECNYKLGLVQVV